ncbi:MerR family transcriptional regulator [Butyrivibrio sp. NC3005]|uniref:MerR family transcriptional regulator n=1 Tax=Butyrivibrio sp. NC3005 TaxID=1280685 RepID=UPI00041A7C1D|nr:methyltransferase domain-containing protein [Butyrivibrio sp. NC3005]
MKDKKYYTSGEFASKAHVSIRTIRFYDKKNLLHPSSYKEGGARLYSDEDFARLSQILLLKYLGFSLDEIREMTIASADSQLLLQNLNVQKRLVEERIEQMQAMTDAIDRTTDAIERQQQVDWSSMLNLIHLSVMEQSFKTQYQNDANITARIRLHRDFSVNKTGWFPWMMDKCDIKDGMRILEVGCGSGAFWTENMDKLPDNIEVVLSDISEGMIRDVRRSIGNDIRFSFRQIDCESIPFNDEEFDLVIANHVLFYCKNLKKSVSECQRVLKKDGIFECSTYGARHMKEITNLVQEFNPDIVLAAEELYDKFGLENGMAILQDFFTEINMVRFEDAIEISVAEPLISYILSCHGNQNLKLLDRYKDFKEFVEKKTADGFHITKDAGIFLCKK